MAIKFIDEIDLKGKKVIARFDFNVPLSKDGKGTITDTTRIDEALQTIRYILDQGATKLIMMSHLGRPDGQPNPKYSLEPVATYLAAKLGQDVVLSEKAVDAGIDTLLSLKETKIVLLENLRFHKEEEGNDHDFAKKLSQYADIYVNDAFGVSHRKHASVYEINAFFKDRAVGGFLLKKEIVALQKVSDHPVKPFMGIVGGAKISDKIKTIEKLLVGVEALFIGGAMAYPFLKAKGFSVGKSLCAEEDVELAKSILAQDKAGKIQLPQDHIISDSLDGEAKICTDINIPETKMALDIGPKTLEAYEAKLKTAKTIFWNGPMGLFENKNFAAGTFGIAKILSETTGFTLVGGGDSVAAVNKSGLASKFSHVSTGGGASLEYVEKGDLPGIFALKFGVSS
jgi:phosphoglycerate kinase